jgi:beta-aspartyl-peptidase (threonine type)
MFAAAALLVLTAAAAEAKPQGESMSRPFRIVVHGGVGAIRPENRTPEQMAAYRADLTEAVRAGQQILAKGGAALDAVEAAVRVLEDSPHFNAGKGAVFTADGKNELDASIMNGTTGAAGAVAGVTRIKNPISLARLVMEKSPHVLLISDGAEVFAKEQGIDWVDPSYFHTERRWKELQEIKEKEKQKKTSDAREADDIYGTVGAVALDQAGHLAAATSTGGMTNKRHGRVGDSPIIGAGTYADDKTCAVSGTGKGEYFIRTVAAHELCTLVGYKAMSIEQAADAVVARITDLGGDGGVIVVDPAGRIALRFNTPAMCRGWSEPDGRIVVQIDRE